MMLVRACGSLRRQGGRKREKLQAEKNGDQEEEAQVDARTCVSRMWGVAGSSSGDYGGANGVRRAQRGLGVG